MSSTHRNRSSSDQNSDSDLQSFQSLSLSDNGSVTVPRNTYLDFSSNLATSSYAGMYTNDDYYGSNTLNSLVQQDDTTGYGPGHEHYVNFNLLSNRAAAGGTYQGSHDSFGSSGIARNEDSEDWDTYTHASMTTAPETYAESVYSDRTASTTISSAPSRHSNHSTVNTTINNQRPPRQRQQLPCEFKHLNGCTVVFHGDEEREWMEHTENHMGGGGFPNKLKCWFCNDFIFDANQTSSGDRRYNFQMRMAHIREHLVSGEYQPHQMLQDGYLVSHLRRQQIISEAEYQDMLRPSRMPPMPGRSGGRRRDDDEAEPSSSGHRDRRSERHERRRERERGQGTRDRHGRHGRRTAR